jgi:high-affinity Fe2+/Pb2+ permease
MAIAIFSSVITLPVAAVLIVTAVLTYRRARSRMMLLIIAAVLVVGITELLHMAQFPALTYHSQFSRALRREYRLRLDDSHAHGAGDCD